MPEQTPFTVLYARAAFEIADPDAFTCMARDTDDAEWQCADAAPDGFIVWTTQTDDVEAAKREYYSRGLLSPGDWVIWRNCDSDAQSEPAVVESLEGDLVVLRGRSGRSIECPYTQISPAEPVVSLNGLTEDLHRRTRIIRTILESSLESRGDKSDECQLCATLNALLKLEQSFNGIEEGDLKHTLADGSAEMLRCQITPEAVQDENCVPVDPPDESCGRTTWEIPPWELKDVQVTEPFDQIEGNAELLGNAPVWVRGWHGPYTIKRAD